jgi:hypothetical protein
MTPQPYQEAMCLAKQAGFLVGYYEHHNSTTLFYDTTTTPFIHPVQPQNCLPEILKLIELVKQYTT